MTISRSVINNRYHVLNQLGAGGMGAVYRAIDRLTGQTVALKQVTVPGQHLQFASMHQSRDVRLALAQEFKVMASLRHPHIVSVLDYGFDAERRPFFTMDYLADSQTIVSYGQAQPLQQQVELLSQVLQVLSYLYRHGILHRDLKPGNVQVVDGQVKVLDFGLAIAQEGLLKGDRSVTGTVAYLAPECLSGGVASQASDLYAVGVMAYEMFAGRHPFDTRNLNRLLISILQRVPDVASLTIPNSLKIILARLLEKEPDKRYPQVEDIMAALAGVVGRPPPPETAAIRESYLQASKFVGREAELGQLQAALAKAVEGQGSVWLVGGESGVGKSRLLDEVRTQALVAGALVLRGQGVEGGGRSYQLWPEVVRRLVLSAKVDDHQAHSLKTLVPDINVLLEVDLASPTGPDKAVSQQDLISAITHLFRQQEQPVVLIMEDLQWTMESLAPLKPLTTLAAKHSLLIIGSYRDDGRTDLSAQLPGAQLLKLNRLDETQVAALSRAMLGEMGTKPEVVNLLLQESEGNVFFLVEVVRALAETAGSLAKVGQAPLPQRVFARGVQQIIQRRLAQVPQHAQRLLKLAAVAGRYLDLKVLNAWAEENDLDHWLTLCADVAVLEVRDDQWRFIHDKLREGILATLTDDEGAQLHRQIAETIEAVYPDTEPMALVLAEHWRAGGIRAKEIYYAAPAIEQLMTVLNYRAAITLAQRTLVQLVAQTPNGEMASERSLETLLGIVDETLTLSAPASPINEIPQPLSQILSRLGEGLYRVGDIQAAKATLTTALAVARHLGHDQRVYHNIFWLSQVARAEGDYTQAQHYLTESLALARQAEDQSMVLEVLIGLGDLRWQAGRIAETHILFSEALTLARQIDDSSLALYSLNRLGTIAVAKGNLAEGEQIFTGILARLSPENSPGMTAGVLSNLGDIATQREDFSTALNYYRQALALVRQTGQQIGIARELINLAETFMNLGEPKQAQQHLQAGLDLALHLGLTPQVLIAARIAGWVQIAAGYQEQGLALLGMVLHHPAAPFDTKQAVHDLLAKLELSPADPDVAAQLEGGKGLKIAEIAAKLLSEKSN